VPWKRRSNLADARALVSSFQAKGIIIERICNPNQAVVDATTWRRDFTPVKRGGLVLMLARICGAEGHGYDMWVTMTEGGSPVAHFDGARFIGYGLE